MKKIVLGTRASKLARRQTRMVASKIKKFHPQVEIEIKPIQTTGDRLQDKALYKYGGKGLFIKEIEAALLNEEIDVAIHSLKDLPVDIPECFVLACYPPREKAADVFISAKADSLAQLPEGSVLGTSSLRRQTQLKQAYPQLEFANLRGNVDTRIEKMTKKGLAGIILAAAGLHRLEREQEITEYISEEICIPAAGQGTLGIEILQKNEQLLSLLKPLNSRETELASIMERTLLKELGGSCEFPLGIHAQLDFETEHWAYQLNVFLADVSGQKVVQKKARGILAPGCDLESQNYDSCVEIDAVRESRKLAHKVLQDGGREIINSIE